MLGLGTLASWAYRELGDPTKPGTTPPLRPSPECNITHIIRRAIIGAKAHIHGFSKNTPPDVQTSVKSQAPGPDHNLDADFPP